MWKSFIVASLLAGCSITFQTKPPTHIATADCTAHPYFWLADYVGTAAGASAFVYGLANQDKSDAKMLAGSAAGLAAIVYLASARNGQRWAAQCRDQREMAPIAQR